MWFGDSGYRICNQCHLGFVALSDDQDFWNRRVVAGTLTWVLKKSCPTCRASSVFRYQQRRTSPAPSSTSSAVTASTGVSLGSVVPPVLRAPSTSPRLGILVTPSRSPSVTPSIAPSEEAGAPFRPSPSPFTLRLLAAPPQQQANFNHFFATMPASFTPAAGSKKSSRSGSRSGSIRRARSVDSLDSRDSGNTRHGVGYVAPPISLTSSNGRTQTTYSIFSMAWKRTVEVSTWLWAGFASMLTLFLMKLVGLIAILWVAVEVCHRISILGFLSSFLSAGALGDFVGNTNLTTICPACDSCCAACEPQTCPEWRV
mmetsp:Transcript_60267/g.137709  ORF Transcript_60267/g.137709 Transcript_60267/m.137709 type:complete len:314 (+) Transcript_60267:38-979(+)